MPLNSHRRHVLVLAAALSGLLAPTAVLAQSGPQWPSKAIRLIVPFPPGGGSDLTARTVGEKWATALGQAVVVENRPGSNGILGTDAVAKAKPDGYTLLLTDRGALGINPSLYRSLPYDPLKSFAHIGIAVEGPFVMVVDPKSGVKTVADLVVLAKSKAINYGSFGNGSIAQLNIEAFAQRLGIKLVHIPYKGAGPAVLAAIQGDIVVTVASPPAVLGHLTSGRLLAVAVGVEHRLSQLPNVPTLTETGTPSSTLAPTFFSFAAPSGTPASIVERLSSELKRAIASPDVTQKLTGIGLIPKGGSPEDAVRTISDDIKRFGALVASIGITPE